MLLEEEINSVISKFLDEEPDATDMQKSIKAYCELDRFEETIEKIRKNNCSDLKIYTDCSYYVIGEVAGEYISGKLSQEQAIEKINAAKIIVEKILRLNGFNPDLEKDNFEKQEAKHKEDMLRGKEFRDALDRADRLIAKYER